MVSDIIKTIERTIDRRYHLERDDREWLLDESERRIKIRAPDRNSIAFSLDKRNARPFAFLSGSPPDDLAKMCDAILFCVHKGEGYLFIIEVKSSHKDECDKQLINGKLFSDWLQSLCREHGYLNVEFSIASVVLWKPRRRDSTRDLINYPGSSIEKSEIEQRSKTDHFPFRFEFKHRRQIILRDLISRMSPRATRRANISDNPRNGRTSP